MHRGMGPSSTGEQMAGMDPKLCQEMMEKRMDMMQMMHGMPAK